MRIGIVGPSWSCGSVESPDRSFTPAHAAHEVLTNCGSEIHEIKSSPGTSRVRVLSAAMVARAA